MFEKNESIFQQQQMYVENLGVYQKLKYLNSKLLQIFIVLAPNRYCIYSRYATKQTTIVKLALLNFRYFIIEVVEVVYAPIHNLPPPKRTYEYHSVFLNHQYVFDVLLQIVLLWFQHHFLEVIDFLVVLFYQNVLL